MKRYSGFFYFLLVGSVLLLLLNCYLFVKNTRYRTENRELLLKNDSLISVTIELRRKLIYPEGRTAHSHPSTKPTKK
jgi:hypothetical protein